MAVGTEVELGAPTGIDGSVDTSQRSIDTMTKYDTEQTVERVRGRRAKRMAVGDGDGSADVMRAAAAAAARCAHTGPALRTDRSAHCTVSE